MTASTLTDLAEQVRELEGAITPLHVERGRQMRQIVEHDIVERSWTFEAATENLASFLGVKRDSVILAIAIANSADGRS